MKSRERNSSDFPAPALTICFTLFAKNNSASFYGTFLNKFVRNATMNLSTDECETLTANLHWCAPMMSHMAKKVCPNVDVDGVNVIDTIFRSAMTVNF